MTTSPPSGPHVLRFGTFEADLHSGELRKNGLRVRLPEQPFQLLTILLEHPGQMVTREDLQKRLWPDGTFVDFEQGLNAAVKRLREALEDSAESPGLIETVPRRGYRFMGTLAASPRRIESLAVLPLANLSGDPEQEYFAEGLTEALIMTLAKIGALRVLSRTSAMRYKNTDKNLPQIARELNVDAVVEGTVQRSGDRVRISAQLLHAATDTHLWAETYDRDLRDVLALESEVARDIAEGIRVKLTPIDQARFGEARPVDPEAYEAYPKGCYHSNRRPVETAKAIECFQESMAKDPTYVAAYAGLADCFSALNAFGVLSPSESVVKAKALAQKAPEMDYGSAEAHVSLAYATMFCDYDFLTAEREFERAIELNPQYATAHRLFGFYLGVMGHYEESYAEMRRAIRLDPFSSLFHSFLAFIYLYARRYDQAVEQCIKTLQLDPNSGVAQACLAWAYRCKSQYQAAIAAWPKAVEFWPGTTPLVWFAETYGAAGYRDETYKILEQLNQLSKERYVTPYGVGRIYATLGEKEESLQWLETAYQQRAGWMVLLKVDPCFDDLRPDPRFQHLMQRMNFPP